MKESFLRFAELLDKHMEESGASPEKKVLIQTQLIVLEYLLERFEK